MKSSETLCRVQIIDEIMDPIRLVPLASVATERCLWMVSQLKNAFDYVEFDGHRYSGLTGPEETPVTSDSVLFWTSDYSTTHKGWRMCTEVASASGDPHVSTINSDSFDLWRTGGSTFVQVHLASVGPVVGAR